MDETVRDRLWVGALALARRQQSFSVADVCTMADVDQTYRKTATSVLTTMATYGFVQADTDETTWRAGSAVPLTVPDPVGFDGTFTYLTAPRTRWTFDPPVVRDWIEHRLEGRVLNLFAGPTELSHDEEIVRNDIDDTVEATYHIDAVDIGAHVPLGSFETVVLDPPLPARTDDPSHTATHSISPAKLTRIKTQIADHLPMGGRVITFGRDSNGLGVTRGIEKDEICLINHPGTFQDTIAVVDRRVEADNE